MYAREQTGVGPKKERLARVCNDKILGDDCGDDVAHWLSAFLGMTSRLVKQNPEQLRTCRLERSQRRLTRKAGSPLPTPVPPTAATSQEEEDSEEEDGMDTPVTAAHDMTAPAPLSLANESQFLLVNEASMTKVRRVDARGAGIACGQAGSASVDTITSLSWSSVCEWNTWVMSYA